jgi:G3E family GTPase
MDDDLGSEIYLDGIVTLVDAKYISQVRRLWIWCMDQKMGVPNASPIF